MEAILIIAFGILSSLAAGLLLAAKKRRAESWPMVAGRFEDGRVLNKDVNYVAELSYSYSANGSYYAGFYQQKFRMRRHAEDLISTMRSQQVFVRYHPENPEESIVREQDNASLFILC